MSQATQNESVARSITEGASEAGADMPSIQAQEVVLTACEQLRVKYRLSQPKPTEQRGRTKKTGVDGNLGPEMDNFVNAGSEGRTIGCYRIPIAAYFENDRAGMCL